MLAIAGSWKFWIGGFLLLGVVLISLELYGNEELSRIVPMYSLSYVVLALVGKFFLGEQVGPLRWAGIVVILAGVAMPKFFNYQSQARLASCKGTLGGVRAGIANFYSNVAVTTGTVAYPTLAELTDGSTMQEALPENPYASSKDVATATSAQGAARTVVAGGAGWAYYDGSAGGNAVFYANTDSAGIVENSF